MSKKLYTIAPQIQDQQTTPKTVETIIALHAQRLKGMPLSTTTNQQASSNQQRTSPSITEIDEPMISTKMCPPAVTEKRAPSHKKRRYIIKQQQIASKNIISSIKKTTGQVSEGPKQFYN